MNIVESIVKRGEFLTVARLQCGHELTFASDAPHIQLGGRAHCPECDDSAICRRRNVQALTDAQLNAVVDDYVMTMQARGFVIGKPEEVAIRRAAAIQDAWRVAFKRVTG